MRIHEWTLIWVLRLGELGSLELELGGVELHPRDLVAGVDRSGEHGGGKPVHDGANPNRHGGGLDLLQH